MSRQLTIGEAALSWMLRHLPIKHGKHRILDRLCPKAWVNGDSVVALDFHGNRLTLDISDLVGWHFAILRNFDPEVAEILLRFSDFDTEEILWDVGANKGTLLYQVAHELPKAKIVAIEPQPELVRQLIKNIEWQDRCQIFEVGLGDEAKTVPLCIPDLNCGSASLVHNFEGGRSISVKIETAETIKARSGLGWPTLVKIDVEGYEPNVIRSLRPAFESDNIKCCVFECHAVQRESFLEIRAAVEPYGYKTYAIRKTVFSTWLEETRELVAGATDYAIVRGPNIH
jgi:FkbM family methyltransferase